MGEWGSIVVLSFSTSLDNLSVGVTVAIGGRHIRFPGVVVISAMNALTCLVTMLLGSVVSHLLPETLTSRLSTAIFLVLAIQELWPKPLGEIESTNSKPVSLNAIVSWRETLALGLGLCLTNVAGGVAAGLAALPPVATTVATYVCSHVLMAIGTALGATFARVLPGSLSLWSAGGLLTVALANAQVPLPSALAVAAISIYLWGRFSHALGR